MEAVPSPTPSAPPKSKPPPTGLNQNVGSQAANASGSANTEPIRPNNQRRPSRKHRFASPAKWRRIEALTRNKQFLESMKATMDQYRQGEAIFPPGDLTWHNSTASSVASADAICKLPRRHPAD